ncbi:MAG TPA: GFA family protein [Phenylobacterium sp.]|nr:GFA family protein [Phenylobacterium sp.]
MRVTGSCLCGAIAYEGEVEPGTIGLCHCADCQKLTGSAFRANIQAKAETFRFLRGHPRIYIKTADSGARRAHAFCGDCGGPVYASAVENPPTYSLRIGALDQRYDLGAPARQIYVERRLPGVGELASLSE